MACLAYLVGFFADSYDKRQDGESVKLDIMKRAILFVVVPLSVLVASLWAFQAFTPTGLPSQQMTRAESAEADEKAIAESSYWPRLANVVK